MSDHFYVTARRGQRTAWLLGPYARHADALANVERANAAACEIDPACWFDGFGTTQATVREGRSAPPGVLNDRIDLYSEVEA